MSVQILLPRTELKGFQLAKGANQGQSFCVVCGKARLGLSTLYSIVPFLSDTTDEQGQFFSTDGSVAVDVSRAGEGKGKEWVEVGEERGGGRERRGRGQRERGRMRDRALLFPTDFGLSSVEPPLVQEGQDVSQHD